MKIVTFTPPDKTTCHMEPLHIIQSALGFYLHLDEGRRLLAIGHASLVPPQPQYSLLWNLSQGV